MSRVLLTGGAGFIGTHTAISLVQNGYEVVILDNYSNSDESAVRRVEDYLNIQIPLYVGDCCDKELLNKIFKENEIDVVIHFAGYKAVGESVAKPLDYYSNNLNATINLLQAMLDNKVKKLVFSSSATVYSDENAPERKEGGRLGCTNPYGWTKYMGEQIIRDTVAVNEDLDAIMLRYFNPVGANPDGVVGENPKGIPNNLMPYIQQVASGKREKLHVFGNDYDTVDGTGVRDYIHVCDLADAHVAASNYLLTHSETHEINIGTGNGVSVLQLVKAFEQANGVEIPYQVDERRPGDVASCYANAQKAKDLLGWSAKKDIVDMCRDAYNWQMKLENKK